LKPINDTQGHVAGDEYIKASARLLCDIFVHSPVFRVGGDEFVVFLRGSDYSSRHELMDKLRSQVLDNKKMGAGVILASGLSEYKPESDSFVSDIFERADKELVEAFRGIPSSNTNDEMNQLASKLSPMLAEHYIFQ
jgi:diguanylate cyclase (GGDEF)-like protein